MGTAIAAFTTPVRRELGLGFVVIAAGLLFGHVAIWQGSSWAILALLATGLLFGRAGSKAGAAAALDVRPRTWFAGLCTIAVGWSVALAIVSTIAARISRTIGYGGGFASFEVSAAEVPFAYVAVGDTEQQSVVPTIFTALFFCTCFLFAAAIGAGVGAVAAKWGVSAAIGLIAAGLTTAAACVVAIDAGGHQISAPYPGVFIFGVPLIIAGLASAWFATRYIEP